MLYIMLVKSKSLHLCS